MVTTTATATLDPRLALSADFAEAVRRHVDGLASDADLALLEANTRLWVRALYRLLDDVAESIDSVRATVRGHQRALIVADLENDYRAIDAVLMKLAGPPLAPLENGRFSGRPQRGHRRAATVMGARAGDRLGRRVGPGPRGRAGGPQATPRHGCRNRRVERSPSGEAGRRDPGRNGLGTDRELPGLAGGPRLGGRGGRDRGQRVMAGTGGRAGGAARSPGTHGAPS